MLLLHLLRRYIEMKQLKKAKAVLILVSETYWKKPLKANLIVYELNCEPK